MFGTINNLNFNNTTIDWRLVDEIISSCKKIVLTTHENPDGDGLGAEVGLYYHLLEKGKDIKIINYSPLPKEYITIITKLKMAHTQVDQHAIIHKV